jgi:hypothetical protein
MIIFMHVAINLSYSMLPRLCIAYYVNNKRDLSNSKNVVSFSDDITKEAKESESET